MLKKFFSRYFGIANPVLSGLSTLTTSFYIERISNSMKGTTLLEFMLAVISLGWWNLLAFISLSVFFLLVYVSFIYKKSTQYNLPNSEKVFIEAMLESVARCKRTNKNHTIRALVTIHNIKEHIRKTHYGYKIRSDGEVNLSVGSDFGVAGRAFREGKVVFDNLPENHELGYPADIQRRICNQLRSVIAAPLRGGDGTIIGTINFDSFQKAEEIGFNDRDFHETISILATVIGPMIEPIYKQVNNIY